MNEQATKPEARQPLEVENLLRLLEQPEVRARLLELLNEEYVPPEVKPSFWQRFSAATAALSSALVVVLAFLVPSLEDQWDRYKARRVIQRHVALGREFAQTGKYKLAEESFAKAFELSENKRLDID